MPEKKLQHLFNKCLEQNISEEELTELQDLMLKKELNNVTTELFENVFNGAPGIERKLLADDKKKAILESILLAGKYKRTEQAKVDEIRKVAIIEEPVELKYRSRWMVAASAILIMSIAGYLIYSLISPAKNNTVVNTRTLTEISPGKNGAILTLANGRQVLLDSIKDGIVAMQGGVTARIVNGKLVYEGSGNEVVYNTMSAPRGRQFQLNLPDGTSVWLNSKSSITYPVVFAGNERNVSITGEVYMEVAKNKDKPFKVNINNKTMAEVLGTQFNISAYEDDENINTTLIEGSVKLLNGNQSAILKPGQQAKVKPESEDDGITVQQADVDAVTAWKNGYFNFDKLSFAEVLRQLERWYDVDIVYTKEVPKIEFFGGLSRNSSLNSVLKALELNVAKLSVEGNKLIIQ